MDAVILAAGEGTRLRPLTSTKPKPMLPAAGKPILEWGLYALEKNGFSKAVIVVGYRKEEIISFFGKKYGKLRLEYVEQKEQLGTGHAVSMAESRIKGDFLMMNGDLLISPDLIKNLLSDHRKNKAHTSMCLTEVKDPTQFGIVEVRKHKIVKITEKPKETKSRLANAGIYIFQNDVFSVLKKIKKSERLEYELTDAINEYIKEGKASGFKAQGMWIDIGRPWDLLDANEVMIKTMKLSKEKTAKIEPYSTIKGDVHIGKNTVIKSGTYIEGPCYIGDDCIIGPQSFIRPYSCINDKAHIGNSVEIKNSIIMKGTKICHLSYVGDSIIGENCNFGAGTNVANLRIDDGEVKIEIKNTLVKSGRRKFGCLMGDNVKTGINVSIMPGRSIYPNTYVEAGSIVKNTIIREPEYFNK